MTESLDPALKTLLDKLNLPSATARGASWDPSLAYAGTEQTSKGGDKAETGGPLRTE